MRNSARPRTAVAVVASVVAAVAWPTTAHAAAEQAPAGGGGGVQVCPGRTAPTVASARVQPELTAKFTAYGNSGRGWTGGDSTYTVPLPGGRNLWLFSDTFLGTVNPDGSRPADTPIVNNTFVEQRGDRLTRTIHGGTPAAPTAVLPPPAEDAWYWLGAGTQSGAELQVSFQRYDRFGPGQWDWRFTGNVLGRFRADNYQPLGVTPAPSGNGVSWASWLQKIGGHTYIYGVEDGGLVKSMHIARVRGHDLRSPWEFWTGAGWSADETASVAVMPGVANEYSVTPYRGMYMLITQDTNELFSTQVVAYFSCSPTGPFVGRTLLFRTPETGATGSYGDADVFTYNAHEHPELRVSGPTGDRLLVTYNVNSFDFNDDLRDVSIYRPRFYEVQLTGSGR